MMKKGCMFNKLTIVCLVIVVGGLLLMLSKMWPAPPFPESERYGCYYNPFNDIYLSFYDDEKNNDIQYIVFSKNDKQDVVFSKDLKKFSPISSDYIKTDKSFSSCFFVFFFKDSKSRINILCPSEDFLENKIISAHSNEFIIDTLSRENSPNFIFDKHSGYYDLTVQDYSTMKCMDGFVSLAHRDSPYTPLCSVRRSE